MCKCCVSVAVSRTRRRQQQHQQQFLGNLHEPLFFPLHPSSPPLPLYLMEALFIHRPNGQHDHFHTPFSFLGVICPSPMSFPLAACPSACLSVLSLPSLAVLVAHCPPPHMPPYLSLSLPLSLAVSLLCSISLSVQPKSQSQDQHILSHDHFSMPTCIISASNICLVPLTLPSGSAPPSRSNAWTKSWQIFETSSARAPASAATIARSKWHRKWYRRTRQPPPPRLPRRPPPPSRTNVKGSIFPQHRRFP